MSGDGQTSRTAVKTYVPEHQNAEWERHADRLDMSKSEFVRTMVQAGRRGFDVPSRDRAVPEAPPESASIGAESGTDGFEQRVIEAIRSTDYPPWDELIARLTDDVEERLDETLQELQADNRVQYSGRHDGYALIDDE